MAFSSDWPQPTNLKYQLHESGNIVNGQGLFSSNCNPNDHHHAPTSDGIPTRLSGSMVEKARQAKLPPPKGSLLKCPRCNSNNTKFCYYNNYNLTQPRHFCKACRRYWTHGGSLRNVPVGGGYRRNNNKKGKNVNPKTSSSTKQAPSPSSRTNQQFQFSPNHYNLTQLGGNNCLNLAATNGSNINQAYHQIDSSLMNDLGFLGRTENNLMNSLFDPTTRIYDIGNNGGISSASMVNSRVYQTDTVKMEEQTKLVNSSRSVLSGLTSHENQRNQYFWTGSDFSFSGPYNELYN